MKNIDLDQREINEIKLALFYEAECNHGTAGHNRLLLIAKLARGLGLGTISDLEGVKSIEICATGEQIHRYWVEVYEHLCATKEAHEADPSVLTEKIYPLEQRYRDGERTADLFDQIMALE